VVQLLTRQLELAAADMQLLMLYSRSVSHVACASLCSGYTLLCQRALKLHMGAQPGLKQRSLDKQIEFWHAA
jgi:hypothetical protein